MYMLGLPDNILMGHIGLYIDALTKGFLFTFLTIYVFITIFVCCYYQNAHFGIDLAPLEATYFLIIIY